MFGYVKALPAELLLKEYELYGAIYCGLCRTGGKKVSRFTRLFLSYDFTALATLRLALTGAPVTMVKKRCPYGLKKKPTLVCDEVFGYTAAAFACLTYCKVMDDIKDEKGFKKLGKRLSLPLIKQMKKRADKLYPDLYSAISKPLAELDKLEADEGAHSLDAYAHGAAEALAVIASYGLNDTSAAIAYEAGYHIGRYVYIIDAIDDLQADIKKGRFNPLIKHFGEQASSHSEEIDETLIASTVRFSAAVGLANESVYTDILQNIAKYGMDNTIKTVYDKYAYKRKDKEEI